MHQRMGRGLKEGDGVIGLNSGKNEKGGQRG
jgi:hypothetical protein